MQFGRAIRSADSVGQFGRPRKQQSTSPFVPDPTSRNQGLPQFRPQKGECVPEAAREELGHLIVSCGAGSQGFWRRSIGLAAQVHGTFGAGVVFGDRPAPPQAIESCFAAQVPTTFPHLRQSSISPAPENTVTCTKTQESIPRKTKSAIADVATAPITHSFNRQSLHPHPIRIRLPPLEPQRPIHLVRGDAGGAGGQV